MGESERTRVAEAKEDRRGGGVGGEGDGRALFFVSFFSPLCEREERRGETGRVGQPEGGQGEGAWLRGRRGTRGVGGGGWEGKGQRAIDRRVRVIHIDAIDVGPRFRKQRRMCSVEVCR